MPSSVFAQMTNRSAIGELVIHIFAPFSTQSPPRRLRVRLHVGRVRAAVRLGEAEAADQLARRHARQVLLLLLLAAVGMDRVHAEARLHGDEAAEAGVAALEFLADEAVADGVHAGAAVAFERAAEQAEPGDFGNQLPRERVILEVLADHREHAVVDHAGDGVLHHPLLFAQQAANVEQVDRVQGPGGFHLAQLGGRFGHGCAPARRDAG